MPEPEADSSINNQSMSLKSQTVRAGAGEEWAARASLEVYRIGHYTQT